MLEFVVPVLSQFVGPKIPQIYLYSFRFVFLKRIPMSILCEVFYALRLRVVPLRST